jgi:hypothetical protein
MTLVDFPSVEKEFESAGIPMDRPGFYDHAAFLKREYSDPSYLDNYATFVMTRPLDEEYRKFAAAEVERASQFVSLVVKERARKGACVDASSLLLRLLEHSGVWCYCTKGATTISYFNCAEGIPSSHYWNFDTNPNIAAGHVWVCAPPYHVVDTTIRFQPYENGEEKFLPSLVLGVGDEPAEVEAGDLISPMTSNLCFQEPPSLKRLERYQPGILKKIEHFRPVTIRFESCVIKYVTCAVAVPDVPIEQMCDGIKCGSTPLELLKEYLRIG